MKEKTALLGAAVSFLSSAPGTDSADSADSAFGNASTGRKAAEKNIFIRVGDGLSAQALTGF